MAPRRQQRQPQGQQGIDAAAQPLSPDEARRTLDEVLKMFHDELMLPLSFDVLYFLTRESSKWTAGQLRSFVEQSPDYVLRLVPQEETAITSPKRSPPKRAGKEKFQVLFRGLEDTGHLIDPNAPTSPRLVTEKFKPFCAYLRKVWAEWSGKTSSQLDLSERLLELLRSSAEPCLRELKLGEVRSLVSFAMKEKVIGRRKQTNVTNGKDMLVLFEDSDSLPKLYDRLASIIETELTGRSSLLGLEKAVLSLSALKTRLAMLEDPILVSYFGKTTLAQVVQDPRMKPVCALKRKIKKVGLKLSMEAIEDPDIEWEVRSPTNPFVEALPAQPSTEKVESIGEEPARREIPTYDIPMKWTFVHIDDRPAQARRRALSVPAIVAW